MNNYIKRIGIGFTVGIFALNSIFLTGCNRSKEEKFKPLTYSEVINSIEDLNQYKMTGNIVITSTEEEKRTIDFTADIDDKTIKINTINFIDNQGKKIKTIDTPLMTDENNIYINKDVIIDNDIIDISSDTYKNIEQYIQIPYINSDGYNSDEYNTLKNECLTTIGQHIKGYEKEDYYSYFEYDLTTDNEGSTLFRNLISDILNIAQNYKPELKKTVIDLILYGKDTLYNYIDLYTPYITNIFTQIINENGNADENTASNVAIQIKNKIDEYKNNFENEIQNTIDKIPYEIDQNLYRLDISTIETELNLPENTEIFYSIGLKNNGDRIIKISRNQCNSKMDNYIYENNVLEFKYSKIAEIQENFFNFIDYIFDQYSFIQDKIEITLTLSPIENVDVDNQETIDVISFTPEKYTSFETILSDFLDEYFQ